MSGLLQLRLAGLAARRTSNLLVAGWIVAVLALAVNTVDEHAPHFGFARQQVWAAFLLGVAPWLMLRAVQKTAPMRTHDAPWLATKSTSNAAVALSIWIGVFLPWIFATCAFAFFADVGAPSEEKLFVAAGSLEVPTRSWSTDAQALRWNATIPAEFVGGMLTFDVAVGASRGATAFVSIYVVNSKGEAAYRWGTRIGSRGEMQMTVRESDTETHALELVCPDPGASVVVLSPSGTLWKRAASRFDAGVSIGIRVVLAGATWLALALLAACFVGSSTAACAVLALWIPIWMSDWPTATTRWIPGADLFDALEIVGAGRAPQFPSMHAWSGALVGVVVALVLTSIALRRWRVSR